MDETYGFTTHRKLESRWQFGDWLNWKSRNA